MLDKIALAIKAKKMAEIDRLTKEIDHLLMEHPGAFPQQIFDEVMSFFAIPETMSGDALIYILKNLFEYRQEELNQDQKTALVEVFRQKFNSVSSATAAMLFLEIAVDLQKSEDTIRLVSELRLQGDEAHRALLAYGLGYAGRLVEKDSKVFNQLLSVLQKFLRDSSSLVRDEAESAIRRLERSRR